MLGTTAALIGAGIGALGGVTSTLLQNSSNKKLNSENIKMQRETNAQNMELQREQWAREDTAVQRRAADLEKAGLSKNLAAGSAASSSLSTTMQAPQNKFANDYGKLAASFNLYNQYLQNQYLREQINTQKATTANVSANTNKTEKETGWIDSDHQSQINLRQAQAVLYNTESDVKAGQASKQLELIDANINKINSQLDLTDAQIDKIKAETKLTANEESWLNKKMATEIALKVAQTNNLKQETQTELYKTIYAKLEDSAFLYDFIYSMDQGLRTSDRPTSVSGINVSQFIGAVSKFVRQISGEDFSVDGFMRSIDNYK